MSTDAYGRRYVEQRKVTEELWGPLIPRFMKGKPTDEQEAAREMFLACLLLSGTDEKRFKSVIKELEHDHLKNQESYPKTVDEMITFLRNRNESGGRNKSADKTEDLGSSFAQTSNDIVRKGKCNICHEKGHYARECPKKSGGSPSYSQTETADRHEDATVRWYQK